MKSVRVAWGLALAFTVAIGVRLVLPDFLRFRIYIDFVSYYTAARGFNGPGNIYDLVYLQTIAENVGIMRPIEVVYGRIYPYVYPPLLAFYLQPLARLKYALAYRVWLLFTWALLPLVVMGTLGLIRGIVVRRRPPELLSALLAVLFLYALPFDVDINQGQVNILLLLFMLTSLYLAHVRRWDWGAGVALAMAAWIKLTPTLLLLFFGMNRRWRVAAGFVVGGIGLFVPTLVGSGEQQWRNFIAFLVNASQAYEITNLRDPGVVFNISLLGAVTRLGVSPRWAYGIDLGVLVLLILPVVLLHRRARDEGRAFWLLVPYLVVMILAAPYAWTVHLVYLYPALVWVFAYALTEEVVPWPVVAALLLLTLLAGVDFPELYDAFPLLKAIPAALRSLNTLTLLGVYAMGLYVSWRALGDRSAHRGMPTVST